MHSEMSWHSWMAVHRWHTAGALGRVKTSLVAERHCSLPPVGSRASHLWLRLGLPRCHFTWPLLWFGAIQILWWWEPSALELWHGWWSLSGFWPGWLRDSCYIQDIKNWWLSCSTASSWTPLRWSARMQAPGVGGALPLQEYRREVPPGWAPNDPNYSLRQYMEKLKIWYRIYQGEDESSWTFDSWQIARTSWQSWLWISRFRDHMEVLTKEMQHWFDWRWTKWLTLFQDRSSNSISPVVSRPWWTSSERPLDSKTKT